MSSTMHAELQQAQLAGQSAEVTQEIVQFAWRGFGDIAVNVDMRTDCLDLVNWVHSAVIRSDNRALVGKLYDLRDRLIHGDVRSIDYCPSAMMMADAMTKTDAVLKPVVRALLQGITVTWAQDPVLSGEWRSKPRW